MCRGSAKALLAKVYATIGSASMKSGKIVVKGGPGSVTNPDGTTSRLMPTPIAHEKSQVAGYEGFDSQEYYRLARDKALEVIQEGEFSLAASQEELWSAAYKMVLIYFCLQTINGKGSLYNNFVPVDYLGYSSPVYNGSGGIVTMYKDHWLQTFDDWEDERHGAYYIVFLIIIMKIQVKYCITFIRKGIVYTCDRGQKATM